MDLAKCPRRYEKKQKDRVAGSKREGDTHRGQCEAAADWHIHRWLFILLCCCNNWRNCVLGLSRADGWRPSSSRLALTLNFCIKMAKWKNFHLSLPIKLSHFQRRNTGASMLCRSTLFVQRLKKPLNIK